MSEATMAEPATANPASAEIMTGSDAPETGGAPVNGAPAGESAAPPDLYAVKMTAEEWKRQQELMAEYVPAITRDRKRAAELRRQLIFPSFILKSTKKLMGAEYIRKKGYNTVDADLVYGSGWLDEDDGGPWSIYAEENKRKRGVRP